MSKHYLIYSNKSGGFVITDNSYKWANLIEIDGKRRFRSYAEFSRHVIKCIANAKNEDAREFYLQVRTDVEDHFKVTP